MRSVTTDTFLVTCEHGGNRIPAPYGPLFRGQRALLASHRGYDPGALAMARALANSFGAPLVASTVSRLLVDLNRSVGHPRLFSAATRRRAGVGSREDRRPALCSVPHAGGAPRLRVRFPASGASSTCRRTASPRSWTGTCGARTSGCSTTRAGDGEVELCARWKEALEASAPTLRVRRNYPYAGKCDGLTSHLRRSFAAAAYVGIELEVNQRIVFAGGRPWTALRCALVESLRTACAGAAFAGNRPAPGREATGSSIRGSARTARPA